MSTDDPKSRPGTTVNPFAPPQKGAAPASTLNPFAPKSDNTNAATSLNPFAGNQSGAPSGPSSLSVNPFASKPTSMSVEPATPMNSQAASPVATSLNPFAQQSSTSSPLSNSVEPTATSSLPPETSLNPFGQSQPMAGSAAPAPVSNSVHSSLNPFEQASAPSVQPAPSMSNFGHDPVAAYANNPSMFDPPPGAQVAVAPQESQEIEDHQDMVSQAEADQIRNLAPLNFSVSDAPSSVLDLPPDLTEGLINRSLAISMSAGAGAVALIIGLLMGIMFDQRRAHNYRVDAWNDIDAALAKPLEDVDSINSLIQESLKQPKIKWDLIKKLPTKLSAVPPTLVATRVPLEQKAALELSKLIHEVNLLFADISEHRNLTLASRGELELKGERKAFEAYRYYAVDASAFLSKCERRGRLNCRLPKAGQIPQGKVVAIHSNTPNRRGNLPIVIRHESEISTGDPSFFIPLKKDQVTGFGSTPIQAYQIRLKSIMERLKSVVKTKEGFEDTLKKKLSISKVFAL